MQITKKVGGTKTVLASTSYTLSTGTTYTFKAVLNGSTLDFYVNGVKQLTATDTSFTSGKFGLTTFNASAEFDNVTNTMTSILTAVGDTMRQARQDRTRARLAEQATGWVKPLVAQAGGIINGGTEADVETILASH